MTRPVAAARRLGQPPRPRAAAPGGTVLAELRAAGQLGPEGAGLLYGVVRAVAVAHGFPPPGGRRAWHAEAVAEVAHDFLADDRTPRRLAHLVVHAVDDESLGRLLHRMVLNFLRDSGRRTEIGRLMVRLRDVMSGDREFVSEPGDRWRLVSQSSTPTSASPDALVRAAAAEPHVEVPRWSPRSRRRAPVADAASLAHLCMRVLDAAAGTVPLDEVAHAIAPRLGLSPMPIAAPVDDCDPFDTIAAPHHADATLDAMRAAEIFAILSPRERLLLAATGTPVRALRSVIGVGPSQAAELQARLRALLAAELRDDAGYEAVVLHLIDQAKAWATLRATGQPEAIPRLMKAT
jgi:hypothetical protein